MAKYAALSTALERARITSIPVFAAAARGSGDRGNDEHRAAVTLAQFQGALALVQGRGREAASTIGRRPSSSRSSRRSRRTSAATTAAKVVEWVIGAVAMATSGAGWTSDHATAMATGQRARSTTMSSRSSRALSAPSPSGRARVPRGPAAAKPRGCIGFWVIRRRCRSRRQHRWSAGAQMLETPGLTEHPRRSGRRDRGGAASRFLQTASIGGTPKI